jgi:two-component system OmpR family sensor kinase
MKHSLQRRLTLQLASAVLLLGVAAAALQFVLAWRELREFQDDMLRQVAMLALAHPGHESADLGRLRLGEGDTRIRLALLPLDSAPPWFDATLGDGLHTLRGPDGPLRVYVLRDDDHTAVVAQPTSARDELAWNGAWRALLPTLALVPLLIALARRLLRAEFAPVVRAARQLQARRALETDGLGLEGLPAEMQPFADAIDGLLQRTHALLRQQQRFVADAAHELRSPLTALALQLGNVRRATTLDEARTRLEPLEQGIARAQRLSEQLLDLARIEAGGVERDAVDLGELARELLAEFHPRAQRRGIDLGLDAPEAPTVTTSRLLLRTILGNALDNALKYTPAGGDVTLSIARVPGAVRLDVADSGPGIAADARDAVFERFHRLHGNAVEGTGLGLAIAREAAARLGATLSLHERAGGGLVLRAELPDAAAC